MQQLSALEIRVLGCLIEKAATTPDQYPLSLNSLTLACNQKTNREPVMDLAESAVQAALDDLVQKNLAGEVRVGGRVPKYQHRFGISEFAETRFGAAELALFCLLFLRGPQTPGELRSRSGRLFTFKDITQVENLLKRLTESPGGPFVLELPREPGKRESRYAHLLGSDSIDSQGSLANHTSAASRDDNNLERLHALEDRVATLQEQLTQLEERLRQLEELVTGVQ
jgi:uncharacterized protein